MKEGLPWTFPMVVLVLALVLLLLALAYVQPYREPCEGRGVRTEAGDRARTTIYYRHRDRAPRVSGAAFIEHPRYAYWGRATFNERARVAPAPTRIS